MLNLILICSMAGSTSWCWYGTPMLLKDTFATGSCGRTCQEAS